MEQTGKELIGAAEPRTGQEGYRGGEYHAETCSSKISKRACMRVSELGNCCLSLWLEPKAGEVFPKGLSVTPSFYLSCRPLL